MKYERLLFVTFSNYIIYFSECLLDYSFEHTLENAIDLGPLPQLRAVFTSDLAPEQSGESGLFSKPAKTGTPTLISAHEQNNRRVDFVFALLQMVVEGSCTIKAVQSIIVYRHEKLMAEYLQSLQDARSQATSPLESRLIKALGKYIFSILKCCQFNLIFSKITNTFTQEIAYLGNFIKTLLLL